MFQRTFCLENVNVASPAEEKEEPSSNKKMAVFLVQVPLRNRRKPWMLRSQDKLLHCNVCRAVFHMHYFELTRWFFEKDCTSPSWLAWDSHLHANIQQRSKEIFTNRAKTWLSCAGKRNEYEEEEMAYISYSIPRPANIFFRLTKQDVEEQRVRIARAVHELCLDEARKRLVFFCRGKLSFLGNIDTIEEQLAVLLRKKDSNFAYKEPVWTALRLLLWSV